MQVLDNEICVKGNFLMKTRGQKDSERDKREEVSKVKYKEKPGGKWMEQLPNDIIVYKGSSWRSLAREMKI